jgi:7,8-dihydroneopterin aldolase/epimerase/oxygenase
LPFTIQLHHLNFFSFHGVHEEERILGGAYEVNIDINFSAKAAITALEQTIDYVGIYEVIKQQMNQPTALLETVAQNMAGAIYTFNTQADTVTISIKKLHPPIENFQGSVGVRYTKQF